jgi:hypothetical protein
MKVFIYNNAKCGATAWNDDVTYDAPCDFANINEAIAWLEDEIDFKQVATGGSVYDAETGELYVSCSVDDGDNSEVDYADWNSDYLDESSPAEDDPYDVEWDDHYWDAGCAVDDVDESNYDPYAGCDMFEVEPFDFGGDY